MWKNDKKYNKWKKMNNNPVKSTSKYNVFSRYLEKIESRTYVSYFSYYKQCLSR